MVTAMVQELSPAGQGAFARLMGYENPQVVSRYIEYHGGTQERAERLFKAFKQYMAVCVFKGGRTTTSREIDDMWHTFLLFTRQYAAFCEEFLSGFIHHEPLADENSPKFYEETRDFATKMFGDLDEEMWPHRATENARCISGGFCTTARFQ